ncbi:MAG TPA: RDD family protein [Candidatus Angelobacter sp.]|nr:RDD family protein [Candidatus Angelobacter sp.]
MRARSDQRNWREEVALRVNRHRTRRRHTGDTASLEFEFPEEQALNVASAAVQRRSVFPPTVHQTVVAPLNDAPQTPSREERTGTAVFPRVVLDAEARPRPRKIIRFPKAVAMERPVPLITEIELAEPAPESSRIMEAAPAEQMELLPSFADIRLEETPRDNSLNSGLELPLQAAQLGRRLFSGVVDAAIVLLALGIFIFSFVRIADAAPPFRAEALAVVSAGAILWLVFQYLFLVYGRSTPGMRAAQLELFSFRGGRASLFSRRCRALASALSVVSVGLGFAWALVDEDMLGWHDRISQTYLKSDGPALR